MSLINPILGVKLLSNWRFILIFFVILILLLGFFGYQQRKSYKFDVCYSKKSDYQWHFGTWGGSSIPVTKISSIVSPSIFQQDFFDATHTHNWVFGQGSPYYFFGTSWGGCALGSKVRNRFIDFYEGDEEFRQIVRSEMKRGAISKSDILTALTLDKSYTLDAPTSKSLQLLITKYTGD